MSDRWGMFESTVSLLILGSLRSSTKYGPRVTFVACKQEFDELLLELLELLELPELDAAVHALSKDSRTPAVPLAKIAPPTRMTLRRLIALLSIHPPGRRRWGERAETANSSRPLRGCCVSQFHQSTTEPRSE